MKPLRYLIRLAKKRVVGSGRETADVVVIDEP
jgi:hypothetical protein